GLLGIVSLGLVDEFEGAGELHLGGEDLRSGQHGHVASGEQLQGVGGTVVEEEGLGGRPALGAGGLLALGKLADFADGLVELLAVTRQSLEGSPIAEPLDSLVLRRRIVKASQLLPAAPLLEQARRQVLPLCL